jgi:uncharacterized paraquat-inducible protein A
MILIRAKVLEFQWETAMAVLFLGAKAHRLSSVDLEDMKEQFVRLDTEISRDILRVCQSCKNSRASGQDQRCLPQLHDAS